MPGLCNHLAKAVAPQIVVTVRLSRWTIESKVLEATIKEVFENRFGNGLVVDSKGLQSQVGKGSAQIDRRQSEPQDCIGQGAAIDPRKQAVTSPLPEPGRESLVEPLGREVDRPVQVLVVVSCDTTQEPTPVGPRRFDQ